MNASEYTQYRPLMFSIAYRMTGSVSDAEDIVQEAFLRATTSTNPTHPKAYLATITTRLAIDQKLRHLGPVSRTWHLRQNDQNDQNDQDD
jgi:DNA-directed RNA polymerase specialized sigma24 family protein